MQEPGARFAAIGRQYTESVQSLELLYQTIYQENKELMSPRGTHNAKPRGSRRYVICMLLSSFFGFQT